MQEAFDFVMAAVFYLLLVVAGGTLLALVLILALILMAAFAGWIAIQVADWAKKLKSRRGFAA
jgi:hypothetical protein